MVHNVISNTTNFDAYSSSQKRTTEKKIKTEERNKEKLYPHNPRMKYITGRVGKKNHA